MTPPDPHALQAGFVLHTRAYGNTSLIVEIFSREQGRISLVAKGARATKSKYYALLQPFAALRLRWGGRGELQTLFDAEAVAGPRLPTARVFNGFYLNELLLRLLHKHDPHPALFDSYADTLGELGVADNIEAPLRYFEIQLLQEIGYGLELDYAFDSGEPIEAQRCYDYRIEQGPMPVASAAAANLPVHGYTLLALKSRSLAAPEQLREAKQLLRSVLGNYLGPKPLASRRLFSEVFQ